MKPFEKMFDDANSFNPENTIVESISDSQIFGDTSTDVPPHDSPEPQTAEPNGNPMQGPAATNTNAYNGQQQVQMNMAVIPVDIAITVIDKAGSTLVAVLARLAGVKVKAKQLEFTAKEKTALEEPTETLLKSMNITLSPLAQFAIVLGAIYTPKIIELIDVDKENKPGNLADKNELNGNNSQTTGTRAKRGPYKKTAKR